MSKQVDPAEIERAVLRARWDVLRSEGQQLRQEMAAAVSTRDAGAIADLNVRVQVHRARLHEFEISAAAYRDRFGQEWEAR